MKSQKDLTALLATLPPGRRRVAQELIRGDGRTYPAVAANLGLHLGTVHQHMRRMRLLEPEVYEAVMLQRARQLAKRHKRTVAREKRHSELWNQGRTWRYWNARR